MVQLVDERTQQAVIMKVSWRLLPILAAGYGIAYMDRGNVSYAALQMNQDLHFSASMYGLGAGIFFLSYSLLEVPSNLFLARFGARRWISRIMLTWGVLAIGMLAVRTPTQFYVMRFLLGAAEAGFFPGVLYYLTHWFPADYSARAVSRFMFANPLSSVVQGVIAGPLLHLGGRGGLAGWQWLFLVEGAPAVLLGVIVFFCLPDTPVDAAWLSARERDWLSSTVAANPSRAAGVEKQDVRAVVSNPVVWALGCCYFLIAASTFSFAFSLPTFLKEAIHWDASRTGFLISCASLIGIVAMVFNGWHSDRYKERFYHAALPLVVTTLAALVMTAASSPTTMGAAVIIYIVAVQAHNGGFWPIPGNLLSGRFAAVGLAMVTSIGNLGAFIGPYLWGSARDSTGSYRAGLLSIAVAFSTVAFTLVLMRRSLERPRLFVSKISN